MTRPGRRWLPALAALVLITLLALTASAALATDRLGGKVRFGDTITVPSSETVDHDLYVLAGTINVNGAVKGDLIVLGGQVTINGPVSGELVIGGGDVTVNGAVAGNLRGSGGQVTINGEVGKDLAMAAGRLTVTGKVDGDLLFAAGQAEVRGNVTGSIEGGAGNYTRTGSVGGTEEVSIGQGAQPRPVASTGNAVLDAIRQFVVVFLLGALALWLIPRTIHGAEETLRDRTLLSFASGLVTCIGYVLGVILVVILMILLGIIFGLLTLGSLVAIEVFAGILLIFLASFTFFVAAAFLADALVGLALGRWVVPALGMRMSTDRWSELGLLAAGAAIVVIVTWLPVVGWIFKLAVVLVGFGALVLVLWNMWRGRGTPAAPATPVAPAAPAAPPPPAPAG
jgi:cytoskeletal protein CcmA (bactofilin family)